MMNGGGTSRSRRTGSACWTPRSAASKRSSIMPARAARFERRLAHDGRSACYPAKMATATAQSGSRARARRAREDLVRASVGSPLRRHRRTISRMRYGRSFDPPAFTAGISLLLGLGVAATTTLFAFVDAVCCDPCLTINRIGSSSCGNRTPDRIALREGPSPGNVLDWVARNDAFDAITAS